MGARLTRLSGSGSLWRGFLSDIATVSAGKVLGGAAAVLTTILLSRWLGPGEFGLFSTCVSLQLLLAGVAGEALDTGAVRFVASYRQSDPARAAMTLSLALMLKLAIGGVLVLAAVLVAPNLAALLFHDQGSTWLVLVVAGGALGLLLFRSALAYLQAHQSFGTYVLLEGALSLGRLLAVVGLALIGVLTARTGILAVATLPLALLAAAFLLVRNAFPWARRVDWAILRSFLWYSGWAMVSVVAVSIHSRLDVLMLGWMRGPEAAGIYAAAFALAVSLELFAGALLTVFLPKIASATGREFDLLCRRYRVTVVPILLGASSLAVPLAHHVMLLAYGPSYRDSAIVFQVLVVGLMLPHFVMPQILLIWVHRPRAGALMDLLALPAIYAGNLLWISAYGPLGAALNVLVVRAAIVVAVLVLARRVAHGSADPGSRPLHARAGGVEAGAGAGTSPKLSAPLVPSTGGERGTRGRDGL